MPQVSKSTMAKPAKKTAAGGSAWELADDLRIIIYGESGTGKTTLWGTFPGPIKAYVCSGGGRPGELRSIDTPENRRKIDAKVINSVAQYCDEIAAADGETTHVLDHAGGLAGLVMKEYLGLTDIPAVKNWGMAQQQEWGLINEKTIGLLRMLFDLPGNVVVTGHERIFKNKDDGGDIDIIKPMVGIALTPGVTGWLHGAADYIVQAFKRPKMEFQKVKLGKETKTVSKRGKGVEYCIRTEPHEVFHTKFRKPKGHKLPDVIVDPSYDKIMQIING